MGKHRYTNTIGRTLLGAFSPLDIFLANIGPSTTFRRGNQSSIINITFVSNSFAHNMKWHVSEHYTHSDHQAIIYEIVTPSYTSRSDRKRIKRWVPKSFNKDLFCELIRDIELPTGNVDEKVDFATKKIGRACDASTAKRTQAAKKPPAYWWTTEVASLRIK